MPQRVQDIRTHSSSGNIVVENLNYAQCTKSGSTNTWAESKKEWHALFETETNKRLILSSAPSSTAPFLSRREDWLENHVLPPARKGARRKPPTPNLFISAFWRFLGGSALARWWVLVLFQRERDNWLPGWLRPCFREATLHQDCWRVELFQRETLHFQDGWRPGGRCWSEIAGDTYIRPQSRLPIRTVAPHNQTLLIPSRPIIQYFAPCLPATGRFASQLSKQQPTFWRTCCRILSGELKQLLVLYLQTLSWVETILYISQHCSPAVVYFFQAGVLFSIENAKFWPFWAILAILSQIYTLYDVLLQV